MSDDLRAAVEEALSLSHEILPQAIDDVIAIVREHDAPLIETRVREAARKALQSRVALAAAAADMAVRTEFGLAQCIDALVRAGGVNPFDEEADDAE